MSDDLILQRRAAHLARQIEHASTATPTNGALAIAVRIGEQQYAFPLAGVLRAVIIPSVTPLPHVPALVLGLGASDGDVLAVFDGSVWIGGARRVQRELVPTLILGSARGTLALAVDELVGLTLIDETLSRAPGSPAWLDGLTREGVLVVRVATLLQDPVFALGQPVEGAVDDDHQED